MMVDVSSDKKWHELGDPELKCYMPGVPRGDLHALSVSHRAGVQPVHFDGV